MANALAQSPFEARLAGHQADGAGGVSITDLSPLARTGFKGKGTTGWLLSKLDAMPDAPNRTVRQDDGAIVAWLGGEEYLILAGGASQSDLVTQLDEAWPADHAASEATIGYPLPRAK